VWNANAARTGPVRELRIILRIAQKTELLKTNCSKAREIFDRERQLQRIASARCCGNAANDGDALMHRAYYAAPKAA
jgi:hypothetical protein